MYTSETGLDAAETRALDNSGATVPGLHGRCGDITLNHDPPQRRGRTTTLLNTAEQPAGLYRAASNNDQCENQNDAAALRF